MTIPEIEAPIDLEPRTVTVSPRVFFGNMAILIHRFSSPISSLMFIWG